MEALVRSTDFTSKVLIIKKDEQCTISTQSVSMSLKLQSPDDQSPFHLKLLISLVDRSVFMLYGGYDFSVNQSY